MGNKDNQNISVVAINSNDIIVVAPIGGIIIGEKFDLACDMRHTALQWCNSKGLLSCLSITRELQGSPY